VTRLSATLGVVKPEHVLAADWLHEAWEPERVTQLLATFSPLAGSYRVDLLTNDFKGLTEQLLDGKLPRLEGGQQPDSQQGQDQAAAGAKGAAGARVFTEPWFGMEGAALRLPEQLTGSWAEAKVAADLALPPPNPYIPSDFSLCADAVGAPAPPQNGVPPQQQNGGLSPSPRGGALVGEASQGALEGWQDAAMGLAVVLASPPALVLDEPGALSWGLWQRRFGKAAKDGERRACEDQSWRRIEAGLGSCICNASRSIGDAQRATVLDVLLRNEYSHASSSLSPRHPARSSQTLALCRPAPLAQARHALPPAARPLLLPPGQHSRLRVAARGRAGVPLAEAGGGRPQRGRLPR
jgi:hypothetical protein